MTHLALSFAERLLPRLASAGIMFALAAMLDPAIVGLYAWMILSLALVQTVSDVAARQVALLHLGSPSGDRFIARFRRWSSLLGGGALAGVIVVLAAVQPATLLMQVMALIPFVLVPAAASLGLPALLRLQAAGSWSSIARAQAVASGGSLLLSLPTLVLTQSLLASALQAAVAEIGFALLCRRAARNVAAPAPKPDPERGRVRRDYLHTVVFAALGWGQGQGDRVGIGSFAGTAALGQYSFALTLSRSLGDAAAIAAVNVIRPALVAARAADDRVPLAPLADRALRRAILLTVVAAAGTITATFLVAQPILPAVWDPAISLVPILTLGALPSVIAWTMTAILQLDARMHLAGPIKAVGVVLCIPIALAALTDLHLAAWLVLGREVVVMLLLLLAARRSAPWRSALIVLAVTGASALIVAGLGAS
ncbi:hypothetical protein KXS11_14510 [Plantibacter flavus]|uniref:hypothetical protein n=1 Tax=Plantibacter flavus TaxID=150123 RepID=UPI003F159D28